MPSRFRRGDAILLGHALVGRLAVALDDGHLLLQFSDVLLGLGQVGFQLRNPRAEIGRGGLAMPLLHRHQRNNIHPHQHDHQES